jgi:hypothetical protein
MEGCGAPSRPAPISPQSSHVYNDLAKAALLAIVEVVIIVFFKKLANYFMRNKQVTVGPNTVQPPRLPPAYPKDFDLELSDISPACN